MALEGAGPAAETKDAMTDRAVEGHARTGRDAGARAPMAPAGSVVTTGTLAAGSRAAAQDCPGQG
jgi:hypothetical protein